MQTNTTRHFDGTQDQHELIADLAEILSREAATCAFLLSDASGEVFTLVTEYETAGDYFKLVYASNARPVALAAELVARLYEACEAG